MLGPTMCRRPSIGTLRRRRYAGRVAVVAACQTAVHRADPPKGVERILNCVISPCRPSSTKIYSHRLGMVDINRQKVSWRATPPSRNHSEYDELRLLYIPQAHCLKIFEFWHFPAIVVLFKLTCLVILFDRKLQVFQKLAKMDHFWHF